MSGEQEAYTAIWREVLSALRGRLSGPTFRLWLENSTLVFLDGAAAVVAVERNFQQKYIEEKYVPAITEELRRVTGCDLSLYVLSRENGPIDLSPFNEPAEMEEITEVVPGRSGAPAREVRRRVKRRPTEATPCHVNPDYTFSTFLQGESNKFALAACNSIAHDPGEAYNPLFLYGGPGLGKTHLLCAIVNELRVTHPDMAVLYVKGEEFTNELVDSLRQRTISEFRDKYRTLDVLLIDDIQFIAGKEGIQEEFFHTFNALHEDNRQIILAADRPPRDISHLESRLRSRFEWGLLADIQPPPYELRVAILGEKAAQSGITLGEEVTRYIAERLRSNIRQLEGAVRKIAAVSFITGSPPSLQMARECVHELVGGNDPPPLKADKIIERVAAHYHVSPEDIRSPKRGGSIATARHVCIYLIKKSTSLTYQAIGDLFHRDHSTVMSSIAVVEDLIRQNPGFEEELNALLDE